MSVRNKTKSNGIPISFLHSNNTMSKIKANKLMIVKPKCCFFKWQKCSLVQKYLYLQCTLLGLAITSWVIFFHGRKSYSGTTFRVKVTTLCTTGSFSENSLDPSHVKRFSLHSMIIVAWSEEQATQQFIWPCLTVFFKLKMMQMLPNPQCLGKFSKVQPEKQSKRSTQSGGQSCF